jgi:hypothetical protein
MRREVERLGVEQHQLLLEADGGWAVALERGPQRIAHGS